MSKIKKVKVEKKIKQSSTLYIRTVSKDVKNKFYEVAKKSNLLPRELFEKLVNEAL
jgi:hypothetical protein